MKKAYKRTIALVMAMVVGLMLVGCRAKQSYVSVTADEFSYQLDVVDPSSEHYTVQFALVADDGLYCAFNPVACPVDVNGGDKSVYIYSPMLTSDDLDINRMRKYYEAYIEEFHLNYSVEETIEEIKELLDERAFSIDCFVSPEEGLCDCTLYSYSDKYDAGTYKAYELGTAYSATERESIDYLFIRGN